MTALIVSPDLFGPSLYSIVSFSHELSVKEAVEKMDLKQKGKSSLTQQQVSSVDVRHVTSAS